MIMNTLSRAMNGSTQIITINKTKIEDRNIQT